MSIPLPEDTRYEPTNWRRYDAILLEKFPGMFKPWDLDDLTLEEYAWLLEHDSSRAEPFAGRGHHMSVQAIVEDLRRWTELSPRQMLEAMLD